MTPGSDFFHMLATLPNIGRVGRYSVSYQPVAVRSGEAGFAQNTDLDLDGDGHSAAKCACYIIPLRNGFSAKGEVRLFGATVGTNLECERASFDNADGNALVAEGIDALTDRAGTCRRPQGWWIS